MKRNDEQDSEQLLYYLDALVACCKEEGDRQGRLRHCVGSSGSADANGIKTALRLDDLWIPDDIRDGS